MSWHQNGHAPPQSYTSSSQPYAPYSDSSSSAGAGLPPFHSGSRSPSAYPPAPSPPQSAGYDNQGMAYNQGYSRPHPQPQQQDLYGNPSRSYDDHTSDYAHSQVDLSSTQHDYNRPSMSRDRLIPPSNSSSYLPQGSPGMPMRQLNAPYAPSYSSGYAQPNNTYSHGASAGEYPPSNGFYGGGGGQLTGSVIGGTGGWGVAREQMMKKRVVKEVTLKDGNLVLDIPMPRQIVKEGTKDEEQTMMRYTAATCDPDDFAARKYTLRPFLYGRHTELFIVMTSYNEDDVLFLRTMNAVIKNINHLCDRSKSSTWGAEGWKKVVVCVVADGRKPIHPRMLKVLTLMGCYAEGVAKDHVGEKEVTAHIFESTTRAIVSPETGDVSIGAVPIQIIFCLKEQNKKKLNSHRWFFNAFGSVLRPEICVLLDVGTKPTGNSIYELWKCFDKFPGVGGCCGEICVDTGRGCGNLINPLVAAQNFEYKMSNILDKPLESVLGFITVLPGAFSAYRYKALLGAPLASYFEGEKMHGGTSDASIWQRNMYLAEDRILCFEIVTKKKEAWRLAYVKSAKASTDVPNRLPEFISQRRRWLNGSFFAALHATLFFFRIWTSGQGFFRKIFLQLEFIYNAVQLIFTWFSVSSFFMAFFFLLQSSTATVGGQDAFFGAGNIIFQVFSKLYIVLIFVILICALGNRPQGSNVYYVTSVIIFGILQIMLLYCAGVTVYNAVPHTAAGWSDIKALFSNPTFRDIVVSLGATYGLYVISSLLHFEPWHLLTCMVQYLLLLPSFVNILLIYSFSNLHDVSWGTKGSTTTADLGAAKVKADKDGKEVLEVAVPTNPDDLAEVWLQARGEIRNKVAEVHTKRSASQKQSDGDANHRTNVMLLFLGSNMAVILIFTSDFFLDWINVRLAITNKNFNPYLTFIFFAVAGLSAIRFLGSFVYLLFRLVGM